MFRRLLPLGIAVFAMACEPAEPAPDPFEELVSKYVTVPLTTDMSVLTDNEREMLPLLIEAAQYIDETTARGIVSTTTSPS